MRSDGVSDNEGTEPSALYVLTVATSVDSASHISPRLEHYLGRSVFGVGQQVGRFCESQTIFTSFNSSR